MVSSKESVKYLNKSWYITLGHISYWWTWIIVIILVISGMLVTLSYIGIVGASNIFSTIVAPLLAPLGIGINLTLWLLIIGQLILNGLILWGVKAKFQNRGGEKYSIFRYWFTYPCFNFQILVYISMFNEETQKTI